MLVVGFQKRTRNCTRLLEILSKSWYTVISTNFCSPNPNTMLAQIQEAHLLMRSSKIMVQRMWIQSRKKNCEKFCSQSTHMVYVFVRKIGIKCLIRERLGQH